MSRRLELSSPRGATQSGMLTSVLRSKWALGLGLALSACGGEEAAEAEVGETSRHGAVLTFATFAQQLAQPTEGSPGVAEGLDLDGRTGVGEDAETCFKKDFIGPDGRSGVDNQLAVLLPLIKAMVGEDNIDVLLEAAIAGGQLLIVLELLGLDDFEQDDDVVLRLGAGSGAVLLDTTGAYELYQTFGYNEDEAPISEFQGEVRGGRLFASSPEAFLPVRVLDAAFNLHVRDAQLEFALTKEQEVGGVFMDGIISGGIRVEDFKEIVQGLNVGEDLQQVATNLIGGTADLKPDAAGVCQEVSAGLKFRASPAFVREGP